VKFMELDKVANMEVDALDETEIGEMTNNGVDVVADTEVGALDETEIDKMANNGVDRVADTEVDIWRSWRRTWIWGKISKN